VNPSMIVDAVCEYYCAKRSDVMSTSRRGALVFMRRIAIYLCREEMGFTAAAIGYFFNKDHTTILYLDRNLREMLKTDAKVREQVGDIRQLLQRKEDERRKINYCRAVQSEPGSADAATDEEVLAGAEVGEGQSGSIKRWRACRVHNRGGFFVSRLRHDHPQLV
jgi:hypothetical protein